MKHATIVLLLLTQSAAAQPGKLEAVTVSALSFADEVPEGIRKVVGKRLEAGLRATGFVIDPANRLSAIAEAQGGRCAEPRCWRVVWSRLGSRYVVGGRVGGADRSYDIALWLADTKAAKVVAQLSQRCELCGMQAVGAKVELAASALRARLQQAARAPGRVWIESVPSGARIEISGKPAGTTPKELVLKPGAHKLTLRREGFMARSAEVKSYSGLSEKVSLRLVPLPKGTPLARKAGWIALGGGVAALGAGIALFVLDGDQADCSGENLVPGGRCPGVWQTSAGAWSLSAVGVAAIGTGAYLLYRSFKRKPIEKSAAWRGVQFHF